MCEILRNHIKFDTLGPDYIPSDTLALLMYTTKSGGSKKKARSLLDYRLSLRSDMMFDQESAGKRKKSKRKSKNAAQME
jgi:hypothetical protein